ncbi:MAG: hypothetical protein PHR69_06170 [Sphaerochaeta sp.]|nr:hypothetical protein [Sphaerochaeta sp.]
MSVLKKLGAVALGTASVTGWVVTFAIKEALETAAKKVGDGSVTSSDGKTYSREDFKDQARKVNDKGFFMKGINKSVELWKEDY